MPRGYYAASIRGVRRCIRLGRALTYLFPCNRGALQFSHRLRRVVTPGDEALPGKPRRNRRRPDNPFPRRSRRRLTLLSARRSVLAQSKAAGHCRTRGHRNAPGASYGDTLRALLEDKAEVRSFGRPAEAGAIKKLRGSEGHSFSSEAR